MEGEENKLTTFSTWTILLLGCNESNIIFKQHLCKLGQLRRSNGRNSQVFGQAMKKRPTGHYSHFKGRDTAPTTSSRVGSCIVDSSTSGERTLLCSSNPRAILSRDRMEDDEKCCTAFANPFTHVYNLCFNSQSQSWHEGQKVRRGVRQVMQVGQSYRSCDISVRSCDIIPTSWVVRTVREDL